MRQECILVHRRRNKLVPRFSESGELFDRGNDTSGIRHAGIVYGSTDTFDQDLVQACRGAGSFGKGRLSQVIRVQIKTWQVCNSGYAFRPLR